ncbi:putative lipoprotein [Bacteriovorax sp. BSW11_IV]|uniref:putative lipoprotein n=1 Tax=Bacteriovorax sp. BSW11_IV TaxID=1353529 RepID=UPI000389F585|nr:putative lipoprotein [Bacteriovorax sp. BSW11_IV]EQC46761.1 putative lipoprotein [Bacteriovorax sp. BSW11_IV]
MKLPILSTIILISTFMSSCSTLRNSAVGMASPLFMEGSKGLEKEGDLELFKSSTPGNLKLLEGLLEVKPKDLNLLSSLVKGYGGYAFAVNETAFLKDSLQEKDDTQNKVEALRNYSKAISYGLRYLEASGISFSELERSLKDQGGMSKLLSDKLSDSPRDIDAVLFTAQSLAGLINLQKTNMALVARLGVAKGMFDWACALSPDFNFGMCDIFFGAYEAARPRMLGGNPEKGKEIFLAAMKKWPENALITVSYIQYYLIPMAEEDEYRQLKVRLENFKNDFDKSLVWSPDNAISVGPERLRLYQSIALERFKIIKRLEKEIF